MVFAYLCPDQICYVNHVIYPIGISVCYLILYILISNLYEPCNAPCWNIPLVVDMNHVIYPNGIA